MKNPFENIFKKDDQQDEKPTYTGETKFTIDETGAVVSEELAKEDKQFGEEKE